MIKKGVSQSNLSKALSVTPANISSWMLGRDVTGNAKVEACFKKWLYYYDVDKIIESHFGLDVDDDEDDNNDNNDDDDDDKKKSVKDDSVIQISNDLGKQYYAPNCDGNTSTNLNDIIIILIFRKCQWFDFLIHHRCTAYKCGRYEYGITCSGYSMQCS